MLSLIFQQNTEFFTLALTCSHPAGRQRAPWAIPRASTFLLEDCSLLFFLNRPLFPVDSARPPLSRATSKCARVGRASPGGSPPLEERPTRGAPQNSRNRKNTLINNLIYFDMIIRDLFLLIGIISATSWVEPNVKINIPKEVS